MKKNLTTYIYVFLAVILTSCTDHATLDRLDYIKEIGNENPEEALVMLDSVEVDIKRASAYAKNKFDLLRVRLNDKADHKPTSDLMIGQLVDYFEKEGNVRDKQEVYYYAGSIYRDLQDTPRALENFFKSLSYANDCNDCDTYMLCCTYSNLSHLFYTVQDYRNDLKMAEKELEICKKGIGSLVIPYMHVGIAYLALDSIPQAKEALDMAYHEIMSSEDISRHQASLIHLLNDYSTLGDTAKARVCHEMIEDCPLEHFSAFHCNAFARYFEAAGKVDSAIIYCQRVLDDGQDIDNMYDAAKSLFRLYDRMGDKENTNRYAKTYMALSDSMDFGTRQELAATVTNAYKYHLDQNREQQLKDERTKTLNTLIAVSMLSALAFFIAITVYIRRKNRYLKRIIALSADLRKLSDEEKRLHEEIRQKEEQNKVFIKLLHMSKLEDKAEDVVSFVKESASGKQPMKASDWKKLYQAVDNLYPTFHDKLIHESDAFNEQQMQFCYLVKIGLSSTQIQNLMNLSRATVWRWKQKYEWIQTA